MLADCPFLALSASASVRLTEYAGIVGWTPSGETPRPMAVASPGRRLPTRTAVAPASCAKRIFVLKSQVPRAMSATLPVRDPAGRAEQASDRPLAALTGALVTTASGAVSEAGPVTTGKSPVMAGYVVPPTVSGAATK